MNPQCRICRKPTEVRHINLYVFGSEGIEVCQCCEIAICDFIRCVSSASHRAHLQGFRAAKEIAQAKAEQKASL